MKTALPTLLAAVAIFLAACSAHRGEPFTGRIPHGDPRVERGRLAFMQHCQKCHPGGEAGLGPALNDKPLPEFLMKLQVRAGLGAMPSLPHETLSAQELDDLIRYLKALRALPAGTM